MLGAGLVFLGLCLTILTPARRNVGQSTITPTDAWPASGIQSVFFDSQGNHLWPAGML